MKSSNRSSLLVRQQRDYSPDGNISSKFRTCLCFFSRRKHQVALRLVSFERGSFLLVQLDLHCLSKMAGTKLRDMRLPKEIEMLTKTPPHGITCWTLNDSLDRLEAGMRIFKQIFQITNDVLNVLQKSSREQVVLHTKAVISD
jgi:hypothetical protein